MKIKRCDFCKSEKFYYFNTGLMIMSNCVNNCLGSLKIYQYGDDEDIIFRYKRMKGII